MALQGPLMLAFLLLLNLFAITSSAEVPASHDKTAFNRSSFPAGFVFGAASSSYQYEGAAFEDGKGLSIWDKFTHEHPEKILDHSNGDVALDSYHRYKEDVALLKNSNMDAYRFSISWPRILPRGKLSGGINKAGIRYYNNLINELLSKGLQPYGTIFHWDVPQALEEEYGGFLSPKIVKDFRDYAEVCFKEFGDRVKYWITLNEPWTFSNAGYAAGILAPGRCSPFESGNCTVGNSGTEPYLVSHHQLLAHAAAVRVYKDRYQAHQKGKIGITLVCHWMVPYSPSKADKDAAQRALDFMYGWFMDPLTYGDYPESMRRLVGKRLPKFSERGSKLVKGSMDFLGLNYYTGNYVSNLRNPNSVNLTYTTDSHANQTTDRNGVRLGPPAASAWLSIYPQGFHDLLVYTKTKYKDPIIYITENGMDEVNNASIPLQQSLNDFTRVNFYNRHLLSLLKAIKEGVRVKGYFAWSLLDNFEWNSGYTNRFGLNFVDYKNGLKRYPKLSALWFKKILQK